MVGDTKPIVVTAGREDSGAISLAFLMPAWLIPAVGLPTLSHRISLGKSDLLRHWAAAGALVLVLATVALAAAAILRSRRNARHVALLCALAALANRPGRTR